MVVITWQLLKEAVGVCDVIYNHIANFEKTVCAASLGFFDLFEELK